jgi:hypothetical protein
LDKYSYNKSIQVTGQDYLAVMCPACRRQHKHVEPGAYCECQQPLDPRTHRPEVIREWWERSLRLTSDERAHEFLLELVNMQVDADDVDGAVRLVKRFPEFFPACYPNDSFVARRIGQFRKGEIPAAEIRKWSLQLLINIRTDLRRLWAMGDSDERDWGMHLLRQHLWAISAHPTIHAGVFDRLLSEGPPPADGLQQAMLYFLRKSYRARICRADCTVTPYFFAEKSNQQFCSETCSRAAQADAKRRWWRKEGERWRKAHRDKKKKGRQ